MEEIGSTQTLAHEIVAEHNKRFHKVTRNIGKNVYEDEVLLITATQQTAGIGMLAGYGSLLQVTFMTFIYPWPKYLQDDQKKLGYIPQISNLAVCQTIASYGLNLNLSGLMTLFYPVKPAGCYVRTKVNLHFISIINYQRILLVLRIVPLWSELA